MDAHLLFKAGVTAMLCAANFVFAGGIHASQTFQLDGSGRLTLDEKTLKANRYEIKATLTPTAEPSAPESNSHQSDRFSLSAMLAAVSMACYNDTIFRDGFDGDGT
jgi:hypothetical protein